VGNHPFRAGIVKIAGGAFAYCRSVVGRLPGGHNGLMGQEFRTDKCGVNVHGHFLTETIISVRGQIIKRFNAK
jgi:hypothetical protein